MSNSDLKTPLREVRLRVAVSFTLIMMSNDALNPVKIICSILNINSNWVGWLSLVAFVVILSANASELTYFVTKVFFHSILTIFFSSMEVIGKQNVPTHGPVIFTGNHMNQFVDGAVIVTTNPRNVGFLVAEKSMKKPLIGDFARACGSIPVARPQDKATSGPGKIYFDKMRIYGEGTQFTKLVKGDKLRPARSAEVYKVTEVISDTEGVLGQDMGDGNPLLERCQGAENKCTYEIMGFVDQSKMFSSVHAALANGSCIGIFPEGGSHDNTDLLPLKAGVAAIALGTQEKYDVKVPIVPIGLTYFRGHRFRGRLVVEFGEPIYINEEISAKYGESKKLAYQALLQQVEKGMRSVIVTAHDYNDLKLVHTVRRLYQYSATSMSTKEKQDLARRWSEAYKVLKERYKDTGFPADIQALLDKIKEYQDALDSWGLRDYQLQHTHLQLSYSKMLYIFLHGLVILSLASIPSLVLNFPVGVAANYWAYKEAKKDLKASRVKLAARDVLLSKKILFSLAAVPILWVSYAVLAFCFTSLETRTIIVLFLCCPLFSYIGVMAMEASIVDLKDLRPAFLRLLPSFKQAAEALPAQRAAIQKELRAMVTKYGPSFGPLYTDKTDAWEGAHRLHTSTSLVDGVNAVAGDDSSAGNEAAGTAAAACAADQYIIDADGHRRRAPSKDATTNTTSAAAGTSDSDLAFTVPTSEEQIARAIATTFCDEDETALEAQMDAQLAAQQKKDL